MRKTPDADRYMVPGLVRGLTALQAFTPKRPRLTLAELAAAAGVSRSAMFRIAYTLTQLAFLEHDARDHSYALGPAVLRLGTGALASRDLVAEALPHLETLRDTLGWSVHLGVLDGTEVVYTLRVPSQERPASIVHVGSRLPAHATSMGRVLLAALPRAELVARYQGVPLLGIGPRTPTNLPALLAQARRDLGRGYVVQMGEFEQGVVSVAAPLRDVTGRIMAAINVAGAMAQAAEPRTLDPVVQSVLACAATISRGLGFVQA